MPASQSKAVKTDPGKPLEISIACDTPHVVVYRVWSKQLAGQWVLHADASTDDNDPDVVHLAALPKGSSVAYWLGVGGNPRTSFRARVSLEQDGAVLPDGIFTESGDVNDDGVAVRQATIATS